MSLYRVPGAVILTRLEANSGWIMKTKQRHFHKIQDNNHTWSVVKHIYQKQLKSANKKYACFLLNITEQSFNSFEKHKHIWDDAELSVAVDGSANCLAKKRLLHTADVISGDFDSIESNLITRLQSPRRALRLPTGAQEKSNVTSPRMPQVIETPCQKETDFTKAVRVAMSLKPDLQYFFGLYFDDGHRLDHLFGLINTLHVLKRDIFILNVLSNNISWLLQPGIHTIHKSYGQEMCSIVPFTGETKIRTSGLRYNLNPASPCNFGLLVSTSNFCLDCSDKVVIETNREVLWSIDLYDHECKETAASPS